MEGLMSRFLTGTALATVLMTTFTPLAAAQVLSGKVTDASGTAPLKGAMCLSMVQIDRPAQSGLANIAS